MISRFVQGNKRRARMGADLPVTAQTPPLPQTPLCGYAPTPHHPWPRPRAPSGPVFPAPRSPSAPEVSRLGWVPREEQLALDGGSLQPGHSRAVLVGRPDVVHVFVHTAVREDKSYMTSGYALEITVIKFTPLQMSARSMHLTLPYKSNPPYMQSVRRIYIDPSPLAWAGAGAGARPRPRKPLPRTPVMSLCPAHLPCALYPAHLLPRALHPAHRTIHDHRHVVPNCWHLAPCSVHLLAARPVTREPHRPGRCAAGPDRCRLAGQQHTCPVHVVPSGDVPLCGGRLRLQPDRVQQGGEHGPPPRGAPAPACLALRLPCLRTAPHRTSCAGLHRTCDVPCSTIARTAGTTAQRVGSSTEWGG